jgi:hypothetical protein
MAWQLTQSDTLAETNENTTSNKTTKAMLRGKSLHERGDDSQSSTDGHSNSSSKSIGLGTRSAGIIP